MGWHWLEKNKHNNSNKEEKNEFSILDRIGSTGMRSTKFMNGLKLT